MLSFWYILPYILQVKEGIMTKPDSKQERLRQQGTLNPHPQDVQAEWFQANEFFDPLDLIQTKYEMLRYTLVDGASKTDAAALFGMSRPTFYQAAEAFAREGIAGLLPKTRGPKGAHKLTAEVMKFINQLESKGYVNAQAMAHEIMLELNLSIHPRTIERAIARKKK